jgi:hypothetical protein
MTGEDLFQSFTTLECYAKQCVERGGIQVEMDSEWRARTTALSRAHNIWTRTWGFPALAPEPQTRLKLIPWVQQVVTNGRDETWLAAALCHIDIARSLEAWEEDVTYPLDLWWPQDAGPNFIHVPTGAWSLTRAQPVDPDWFLQPVVSLLGIIDGELSTETKYRIESTSPDAVRMLPGFLSARWLTRNFKSHGCSDSVRKLLAARSERVAKLEEELEDWDIFTPNV